MALRTLGTAAQTTLSAVQFGQSSGYLSDSDLAAINALIKPQTSVTYGNAIGGGVYPYLTREGQLWIPGQGFLKVSKGDFVAVDPATGWPIVISAGAAAGASYVHT
jgi:hypothetical protein